MSATIIIKHRDTGFTEGWTLNSLLDDAKADAEAKAAARGGLAKVEVTVTTGRGGGWRLVPRDRNTGPGRYRWERMT